MKKIEVDFANLELINEKYEIINNRIALVVKYYDEFGKMIERRFEIGKEKEVINNAYAELRKAFYDGKIIQYQDAITESWYDFKSEPEWEKFNPMRLRIKPKKPMYE